MTRAQATRQARGEITMYRQGSGWIISEWLDSRSANILSGERPYFAARIAVSERRAARIEQLLAR